MSPLVIAFVGAMSHRRLRRRTGGCGLPHGLPQSGPGLAAEHTVEVLAEPYGHPAELMKSVRLALQQRPRVVVIEVVATVHEALYVDRWDTVSREFFISGMGRPTVQGHSVWGHLLADHLLREGLV